MLIFSALRQSLVIEAEVPFATLTDVNLPIPGSNNSVHSGATDPVFHLTYFFVADPRVQRWLVSPTMSIFRLGVMTPASTINVASAHQTTDVPQIGYTEGLGKFSPALNGLFVDFVGNVSLHSNGKDPINVPASVVAPFGTVPGVVTFDTLTQRPSYDVKAFLRYEPKTFQWVALGIEKSWGGEQVAVNGRFASALPPPFTPFNFVAPLSSQSLSKDDYLRGHLEFQFPLAQDLPSVAISFTTSTGSVGSRRISAPKFASKFFFRPSSMPTK